MNQQIKQQIFNISNQQRGKTQYSETQTNQENKQIQNIDEKDNQIINKFQNLNLSESNKNLIINKIQKPTKRKQFEIQSQFNNNSQTKFYIDVDRKNIAFGRNTLFPGSIEEVDVTIGFKEEVLRQSNNPYLLRVIAKCTNSEFNDLDQYIFSVRSNQKFQYFQQVRFKIKKKQRAQVKVAVKMPRVRRNYLIQGYLEIQLENLTSLCIPIFAKCQVPEIYSLKNLYQFDENVQVIKIPGKKNQMRMPPIPFKNLSNLNFTVEVEAISNQNFSLRAFDIITQNFVNCQAHGQFFVNIQLKENLQYRGSIPNRDTIRKILVFKIKNSSIFYHYPLQINVFESSITSIMS